MTEQINAWLAQIGRWIGWGARETPTADAPETDAASEAAETLTLFLLTRTGTLRHEIALHHVEEAPPEYVYGGCTYERTVEIARRQWTYKPV